MKIFRIFLLVVMVLVMTASYSVSSQVFAEKAETHASPADNSDSAKIVIDDKAVSESLDSYFAERKNEYLDCRDAVNDIEHQNFIRDWAADLSITIDTSKIDYTIRETLEERDTAVKLLVYEWVMLDYTWHDPDTGEIDIDTMGFGTDHVITISCVNGEVEKDSYIEITNYEHYDEEDLQYIYCEEPVFDDGKSGEDALSFARTFSTYSAAAAVAYSNQWCGQSVAGQSSPQNPNNYNPAYYYYGHDCCNFVSQCVHAGGIPMVSNGWETTPITNPTIPIQDTNHAYSSHPWISVPNFKNYMVGAGYNCVIADSTADCLIGNPIFWLKSDGNNSNHNMLIVGKTGSSTVKINAHNPDAYRFLINLSNKIYYTIDFVHNYSVQPYSSTEHKYTCSACGDVYYENHTWSTTYSHNAQQHWKTCNECGSQHNLANHIWLAYQNGYRCKVCLMYVDQFPAASVFGNNTDE